MCVSLFGALLITAFWMLAVSYVDYRVARYNRFAPSLQHRPRLAIRRFLGLPWDESQWLTSGIVVLILAYIIGLAGLEVLLFVVLVAAASLGVVLYGDWQQMRYPRVPGRAASARLKVVSGEHQGTSFRLSSKDLTIGREPKNSIQIKAPTTSRVHARIVCANGTYYLEDLGSRAGTYLNGQKIHSSRAVLKPGDHIQVSGTVFQFRLDP